MKKEYEQLKEISGWELFKANVCLEELEIFCAVYGKVTPIVYFDDFIKRAEKEDNWIEFLLEEEFIKEKKTEYMTFETGGFIGFKNDPEYIGMLSSVDSRRTALITMRTIGTFTRGARWSESVQVENSNKISEEEMVKIIGTRLIEDIIKLDLNLEFSDVLRKIKEVIDNKELFKI